MCYYSDDIIRNFDISFNNILLDEKLYENISVYEISYKISTGPETLHIRFDKIDGFITACGKFRHLVLFDYRLFDKVCDRIKYLISEKRNITEVLIIILEKSELIHISL